MSASLRLRPAQVQDAAAICEIYNHYVLHSGATFEEEAVCAEEMAGRIIRCLRAFIWLVAETDDELVGYAYATSWKPRSAYRNTVETAVYVAHDRVREGAGRLLLIELIRQLRERGLHCALAGICLPNDPSVALHEELGFRKVGELEEVGFKFGQWLNVGYWELKL